MYSRYFITRTWVVIREGLHRSFLGTASNTEAQGMSGLIHLLNEYYDIC